MEPQRMRDLLWFGNLILILAVLSSAFFIIKQMNTEMRVEIPEPPPVSQISKINPPKLIDYSVLWELAIHPEPKAEKIDLGPTPEEELGAMLKVDDVYITGNKDSDYAVLVIEGNKSKKIFSLGDVFDTKNKQQLTNTDPSTLENPAVVVELSDLGVYFLYKETKVLLQPDKAGVAKSTQASSTGATKESVETSKDVWKIAQNEKEEVINRSEDYIREVGLTPFYERGRFAGLKLKKLGEESLLHKRGFRQHDVVQKINGAPLQSSDDLSKILEREKGKRRFTIEVNRLGKNVTLTFDFD